VAALAVRVVYNGEPVASEDDEDEDAARWDTLNVSTIILEQRPFPEARVYPSYRACGSKALS
jgi:hypothetical protein